MSRGMRLKHRSQFEYDGENSHAGPLRLTPDDIAILKKLNPEIYTYLPAPWLHALVTPDKNYIRFAKRAATLARWHMLDGKKEPPLLKRHQVPLKHAVYSRSERGDVVASEPNPYRSKDHFAHHLLNDMVQASIEIGANKHKDFQLVHWPQLRDEGWTEHGERKYISDEPFDQKDPHIIPIRDERGKVTTHTHPDGPPFLVKYAGNQLFVLGKEIDRSTEPLETSHASRRNIKQKLEQYRRLFQNNEYRKHYGFPNSILLFVFVKEARMNSVLKLAESVFDKPCPYIAYYHWRDWYAERSFPEPTDHIFTAAGKRLGRGDFKLCDFWNS